MAVTINARGTSVSSFEIGKGGSTITADAAGYLTIADGATTQQPIGYNTIPIYEIDASDTFDLAHAGMMWHKDSGAAVTFTCDNDSTIPQGSTWIVHNDDAEDITIAQGTGVTIAFLASGAAPSTGNVTVSQGGIVTVYKYTDTEYWVWGDDGPFNILTEGSTVDSTLRWSGTAWAENTAVTITSTGVVTAASTAGKHTFSVDSATTNADIPVLTLSASSTGTPAAGIGPSLQFEAETAASNLEIGGEIALEATDVTATTEDFDFVFNLMSAGGAASEAARITSTGSIFLPEKADADADRAGYGQLWVDLATPNVLYFTDDAGTDYNLLLGGTVTSVSAGDGLDFTTITSTGSVTMGTPGSLSSSSTNAVTATSHTHEITSIDAVDIAAGNLASGVLPYATVDTAASAYKIPFLNTTGTASGNFGLLHDTTATFTYNPSTNTVTADNFAGNASTASQWQTTRTINMTGDVTSDAVNIDGSGNITITNTVVANDSHTHDANNLTGTTLASGVVTSSLTTVGTIGTGVWQGTAIDEVYGGTGQTTLTTGDMLYASASNTFSKLALGNVGEVLTVVGSNVAWSPPAIIEYAYSSTVTAADPGAGTIRFNSVTIGSITNAYIDDLDASGDNAEWILSNLADGDILTFRSVTDAADYIIASVNGTPTDGTGYWTVPLTLIHTGTIFTDTDQMRVSVEWAGSNAASGLADGTTTGELLYWTGSAWTGSSAGTAALEWTPGSSQLRIGDGTTGQFDISVSGNIGTIDASSLGQVSLSVGKFRLGTSNVKFELREHGGGVAAPNADSGYMIADSITWSDIVPTWVDENTNTYPMSNPDGHWFQFSTLTSAADPGSGYIRFNSATPASVTNLYIDDLNHHGNDEDSMLSNLADGDLIRIRSSNAPDTVYWMGTVNGTPTDNTGWWTVPVTHVASGTLPTVNTALQLEVQWLSQAGSGGLTGTIANDQVVVGTGASTVDSSANLTFDGSTLVVSDAVAFAAALGDKISLYDDRIDGTTGYNLGVEGNAIYYKSGGTVHRWYIGVNADGGTSDTMELSAGTLTLNAGIDVNGSAIFSDASFGTTHVERLSGTGASAIRYSNSDGTKGYAGFDDNGDFTVYDAAVGIMAQISAAGSLYLDQSTTADADIADYGQIWVRDDAPNTLMYTDDAGNDFTANNVFEIAYTYSSAVTSTDPGAGTLNFNSVTIGSITTVYIDDLDDTGRDNSYMLSTLADGDLIEFRSASDPADYIVATVNGAPTDSTGFWTISLTLVNTGTIFTNGDQLRIIPTFLSQAAGSGGTVTSVSAGNGMDFTTITSTGSVTLGTPGSITATSTNAVTATSHTHAIDSAATGFEIRSAANTDAEDRLIEFTHSDSTRRGLIGYTAGPALEISNEVHGANIVMYAEDNAGTQKRAIEYDPDTGNTFIGDNGWEFETSQGLTGTEDNYVLTYDNSTGRASFEPAASGTIGGSITDNQVAVGAATADSIEGNANFTYVSASDTLTVSGTTRTTATVQTTTATQTEILAYSVASGTSIGFEALIMGREDATGDTVLEKITGLISNEAGTTALIDTPGVDRHESAGATTWAVTVAADDTTDELTFDVTGEASHTIDWKIKLEVIVI